jgi:hypothetical protein
VETEEYLAKELRVYLYNLFDDKVDPFITLIRQKMKEPIVTCDL